MAAPDKPEPAETRGPSLSGKSQLAVLSLALLLRLFVLAFVVLRSSASWLYGRGIEIGLVAQSLLAGHGFSSPFGGQTGPTALIAPGYPIFVAGVFRVFGVSTHASAIVIMLIQIAANLLTIWLMMHLAARFFGARAAMFAGLFWACWLPLIWLPTIFWETCFSACMLIGLIQFASRLNQKPTKLLWVAFGLFCGVASLINMALLITLVAVFMWLALRTWRRELTGVLLAGLIFSAAYSIWPIRNANVFHAFVPLRTTVGLELLMGNHPGADGYQDESLFPMYNQRELAAYLREGEVAYNANRSSQARAWISSHPSTFIKLTLLRFVRFWTGTGMRNGSLLYGLGATFTTVFGFVGLFRMYRSRRRNLALLFTIPLLLFPLPYYITHAEFRYRIVLDPLLTVLAAYVLASSNGKEESATEVAPA